MIGGLYNLLLYLCGPPALLLHSLKLRRRGKRREGWAERLGWLPPALIERCRGREVLWVHAVSVGETNAARSLIAGLKQARPEAVVVLSQITEQGRQAALGAGADGLFYLPFDLPGCVNRVLRQLRPRLLCTVDTELWPNLLRYARRAGVAVAVTNGRLSDRSLARIQRFHLTWFYRWILSHVELLLVQSELDAERFRSLGAAAERVIVCGNIKVDEEHPSVSPERLAEWRELLGLDPAAPVLLAGSTGPGEEASLLAAWQRLRESHPALRLILVPRAIERTGEILDQVVAAGALGLRRSQLPARADESRRTGAVIVVDTIGELGELYAVATVAFVGRSLNGQGGSNVLQAAGQGKFVLTGPDVANVRESVQWLAAAGVLTTVTDVDSLVAAVEPLLNEPARVAELGDRARAAVAANRGATARTVDRLLELSGE